MGARRLTRGPYRVARGNRGGSGGDREPGVISEQQYLDLEREAFLSLLGTKKTQARIQHMLKEGKPLRN